MYTQDNVKGSLINNLKRKFFPQLCDPEYLDVVITIKFHSDYFWIVKFCFQHKDHRAEPLK